MGTTPITPTAAGVPRSTSFPARIRTERWIATGRVVLAVAALVAVWHDPTEPAALQQLVYVLLGLYVVYATAMLVLTQGAIALRAGFQVATHVADLTVFTVFMLLVQGPTSPFFVYFTFSLVAAAMRWQSRGVLWTAAPALILYMGLAGYAAILTRDPLFELDRFIVRSVYLAVVAFLLGYFGAYELRTRQGILQLAAWPQTISSDFTVMLGDALRHAARVLDAPRLVLAWEEAEEPARQLAHWTGTGVEHSRERPGGTGELVAGALVGTAFFCEHTDHPAARVWYRTGSGVAEWRGRPLHHEFRRRFAIERVLVTEFADRDRHMQLFVLDKAGMTVDDLVLGEVVTQELAARLSHFNLLIQARQAAVVDERLRLARDLHDGLLQALTAATLQLASAQELLQRDPATARERLRKIQELIAMEQRDLRLFIRGLKPATSEGPDSSLPIATRLESLAETVQSVWGIRVQLERVGLSPMDNPHAGREVYRIVQEALINAARHADATSVEVAVRCENGGAQVVVADDGHGFDFTGQYDHATLARLGLGPVSLRERVARLRGTLTVQSSERGARLEITLPMTPDGTCP